MKAKKIKIKEVKDFFSEEEIRAARKSLEKATEKNLEDSRMAQIEAVKKSKEIVLD